jgi:hypothetical protein
MEIQRKQRYASKCKSKEIVDLIVALAPQAQARIKILEKLPALEPPEQEDTESFKSVSRLMLHGFPHREL